MVLSATFRIPSTRSTGATFAMLPLLVAALIATSVLPRPGLAAGLDPFALDLAAIPNLASLLNASSHGSDGFLYGRAARAGRGRALQQKLLDTSSIYKYCWRDTYLRKAESKALLCPFNQDKIEGQCMDKCRKGFEAAGPVCVHDCSGYGGGWTNCGMGCAPNAKSCLKEIVDQFSTSASWIANTVLPGARAFTAQMQGAGAPVAMSFGAVKGLSKLSGDTAFIAEKTFEKRSIFAMLAASHGRKLDLKGAIVGFFSPETANKASKLAELRNANKVPIDLTKRTASTMVKSVSSGKGALNIEDIAKFDPTGTLPVLLAFGHPVCSNNKCAKCNVTSNPCVAGADCINGQCGKTLYEADGTPCVEADYQGNTFPGFCQSGTCKTSSVQSFYASGQQKSMWLPEGINLPKLPDLKVKVGQGVSQSDGKTFIQTSLNFWHSLSRQSRSCTFNNGGCGMFACRVDFKRKTTLCVDPTSEWLCGGTTVVFRRCLSSCDLFSERTLLLNISSLPMLRSPRLQVCSHEPKLS
eukprot:TRINITY_DN4108_c0_g1_i2.p1 TRINITY_DN4108_c0_g1~~TRINITY_DN4108_c0_g1_i2.p1  ORF type:complete len:525 (+),score=-10.42 TRINITY_DN4108_c0_g1_i2:88-1662(+)